MPQFVALQCASCAAFQVQQDKQSKKFACSVCGAKQSFRRSFAVADQAKDARLVVQQLNALRAAADAAAAGGDDAGLRALEQQALEQQRAAAATGVKRPAAGVWRGFVDQAADDDCPSDGEDDGGFATSLPDPPGGAGSLGRGSKRRKGPAGGQGHRAGGAPEPQRGQGGAAAPSGQAARAGAACSWRVAQQQPPHVPAAAGQLLCGRPQQRPAPQAQVPAVQRPAPALPRQQPASRPELSLQQGRQPWPVAQQHQPQRPQQPQLQQRPQQPQPQQRPAAAPRMLPVAPQPLPLAQLPAGCGPWGGFMEDECGGSSDGSDDDGGGVDARGLAAGGGGWGGGGPQAQLGAAAARWA
ncbi:mrnip [Scenedesmus sp. PABB004]|nr:mrnip [Scenedesmus sp. PABB004]